MELFIGGNRNNIPMTLKIDKGAAHRACSLTRIIYEASTAATDRPAKCFAFCAFALLSIQRNEMGADEHPIIRI